MRAELPPHVSKDSAAYPIYERLMDIHAKLDKIAAEKSHTMCVACDARASSAAAHAPARRRRTWLTMRRPRTSQ